MARIDLLPREQKSYKANLHNHCTVSDGKWTKEEVKEEYQKRGYSIVAFTDHNKYEWQESLCDENFLAIASLEVNIEEELVNGKLPIDKRTYHINLYDTKPEEHRGIALPPVPIRDYFNKKALNDYIKEMSNLGFLACYNHPWWSLQNYDDYKKFEGLFAMEIYNHGCEKECQNGYARQAYDEMLRQGQKIFCIASDDNHNKFPTESPMCDSFGGWVNIKSDELSYEAIMNSLKNGNFYASTGPEIFEFYIDGNTVHIECSPVKSIFMTNDSRRTQYLFSEEKDTITQATFTFTGKEKYIRFDCEDVYRKHAFTNAYFL